MASSVPPVKGVAFTFDFALESQADNDIFKTTPTLAAGDITVSKDGGDFANIGTLPTQIQTTGVLPIALTADEMNADRVTLRFHDAAGDEWRDALVTIHTCGQTLDAIEALVDDIGIAGAGLTALGDARLANLDATVSSRSSHSAADVWSVATRTLTSFGTLVADVWAYATRTVTNLAAMVDAVWDEATSGHATAGTTGKALSDAGAAGDPWAAAVRTLTSSAAATTAAVSGSTLTITSACTYNATLTGVTIPADWLDMWFTVKDDDSKADSAATIQIHKSNPADAANDGLVYLNGAAGTKADGALTVDQAAGTVAIRIEATATDDLTRQSGAGYDVKVQSTAAGVTLLTAGTCNIELTETKTID